MEELTIGCLALVAYLIGAIPTSVWLGRARYGVDVREHGSGNAGATNTFRVLGRPAGITVMVADVLKGFAAASLATLLVSLHLVSPGRLVFFELGFGLLAVLGHIYPVYVGFRGGKGIATLLGMALAIHLDAALLCVAIFVVVLLASKYVSLSSMVATLAFPVLMLLRVFGAEPPILIVFGFALFLLVLFTHQKNIIRLLHGEESRTVLVRLRKRGE